MRWSGTGVVSPLPWNRRDWGFSLFSFLLGRPLDSSRGAVLCCAVRGGAGPNLMPRRRAAQYVRSIWRACAEKVGCMEYRYT